MFTGLVERLGLLTAIKQSGPTHRFSISVGEISDDCEIGDSVSLNGCCLTVVAINGDILDFEAGTETLSRTNLGELTTGSNVNVERALAVGDRLGGHYVTGHIDTLGTVLERNNDPPWANFKFSIPPQYGSQVVGKGSIAIDGVSLTVVDAGQDWFTVALIPHTLEVTTLGQRNVGDKVNLETDVLAKYVEKSLLGYRSQANSENP